MDGMTDKSRLLELAERISHIDDHPSRAYRAKATVFLPETKETSVRLANGEHLFVLTDNGVADSKHCGPQEVLVITEDFGCWPVVALRVRSAHVNAWRELPSGAHIPMMKRVRARLLSRKDDQ